MPHLDIRKKKLLLLAAAALTLLLHTQRSKASRERLYYVRDINLQRKKKGEFYNLVRDLRSMDPELHFKYFRMTKASFNELLGILRPHLERAGTHRSPVPPEERLALTLRILATGAAYQDIAMRYYLGKATVAAIFVETIRVIWDVLGKIYVPPPTEKTWEKNAEEFWEFWDFPHCCGSIDGKHVQLKCPGNSASQYFNYKGSYSIVLMAVVDAQYRFTAVDVGGYGRQSDGGTFKKWKLGSAIEDGTIGIPAPSPFPLTADPPVPFVFVADAAFPLKNNLMVPFGGSNQTNDQLIFNYRLSRARRIVENAFGILAARWRVFRKAMEYTPETAENVVLACIALHNFMRSKSRAGAARYLPPGFADSYQDDGTFVPGNWRKETEDGNIMQPLAKPAARRQVNAIRDLFCDYFLTDGKRDWQEGRVIGLKKN